MRFLLSTIIASLLCISPHCDGAARFVQVMRNFSPACLMPARAFQAVRSPAAIFKPKNFTQRSVHTSRRSIPASKLITSRYRQFNPRALNIRPWAWALGAGVGLLGIKSAQAEKAETPKYEQLYEKQRKKYYDELLKKPWASVAKKYMAKFEAEEKKLMKEFFELVKITPEEFEAWKIKNFITCQENYKKSIEITKENKEFLEEIPKEWRELIQKQLQAFDLKDISIFLVPAGQKGMAAGLSHIGIDIGSNSYYRKIIPQQKVIQDILHEIMHLLHGDSLRHGSIKAWLDFRVKEKKLDESTSLAFDIKHSLFFEKRADIFAALEYPYQLKRKSEELFQAVQMGQEGRDNIHPPYLERANYYSKLDAEIRYASAVPLNKLVMRFSPHLRYY